MISLEIWTIRHIRCINYKEKLKSNFQTKVNICISLDWLANLFLSRSWDSSEILTTVIITVIQVLLFFCSLSQLDLTVMPIFYEHFRHHCNEWQIHFARLPANTQQQQHTRRLFASTYLFGSRPTARFWYSVSCLRITYSTYSTFISASRGSHKHDETRDFIYLYLIRLQ